MAAEGASSTNGGDSTRTSLDGHGIFAIVVFAIVALICIQPVHIPIPSIVTHKVRQACKRPPLPKGERSFLVLNHVWTPFIGILFLLATKTIGGEQIKIGIVGEEGVEPYDVLIFFISLAYIAISLDATGLLRYLAFQVCLKAGTNGMTLYLLLYGFFWTLGVLVGNDPVILSGTAFLVYLTRVAGITPPSAWIWAQFVSANISSAVLVSSNPTNLVIASGFNLKFTTYTAYMILPALVSALTALGVILLFFRNRTNKPKVAGKPTMLDQIVKPVRNVRRRKTKTTTAQQEEVEMDTMNGQRHQEPDSPPPPGLIAPTIYIPTSIVRPDVNPREALVDPKGAIFASIVMAGTLITVIVTNVTGGAKVYMVAAPGAGLCLARDIVYDWYTWRAFRKSEIASNDRDREEAQQPQPQPQQQQQVEAVSSNEGRLRRWLSAVRQTFPTVTYVFARLPFPLLPFAFGMFILVQALQHVGFINILAGGLGDVCTHGYVGCSFFISTLGVILCNLGGTNIGSTILLTRSLQSVYFQQKLPKDAFERELIVRAASYSVAFGSNVGALGGTFAASLAGLLWRDGLRQRGVLVSKGQFALWCAVVIVPATVSGVAVLLPEVRYFHMV